jgi:hypothetical protein
VRLFLGVVNVGGRIIDFLWQWLRGMSFWQNALSMADAIASRSLVDPEKVHDDFETDRC